MPQISKTRRQKMVRAVEGDQADVAKWTERLGSPSTRNVWPRRLAGFCVDMGTTPGELIRLAGRVNERGQRTELRDLLSSFEKRERSRGKKGSTVAFTVKVVKSWLAFNGVEVPRGLVKVRDADDVYSEAALTKEELRAVLHAASRRERAAVALMAFSGFRPMVLGNYDGSDGLRVRDFVDLDLDLKNRTVTFSRIPARIVVRQELSKAKHVYCSFLTTEGCEYVSEYLTARMRPNADWKKGEKIGLDSPVVIPERAARAFIVTTNIGDMVRSAIRKAGLTARPYALRTTFATRLLSAEAEGRIPHSLAQFFMGHRGDMTARYAQNRGHLPPEVIEQMREAFARCEAYLSTAPPSTDKDDQSKFNRRMLELVGEDPRKADNATDAEIREIVLKRLLGDQPGSGPTDSPRKHQKVVGVDEANRLMGDGWLAVTSLGNGLVVIEAPTPTLPGQAASLPATSQPVSPR